MLFDNGTLEVTESFTTAKNVIANNIAHFKISGGSGAIALVAEGPGTLSLANATNDHSGGTTLTGNVTLPVSADGTLGAAAGALTFDDATLQATDTFTSARGITSNTNAHLKVDSTKTLPLSGKITGAGALTAEGPVTLALTDTANDYLGEAVLTSGVALQISDDVLGAATGALTFDDGTLHATNTTVTSRPVTLNYGSGTIDVDSMQLLKLNGDITGAWQYSNEEG